MRVSLFGLFPRCTSLMEPWSETIQSDLLVLGFIGLIALHVLTLARHLAFASSLAWGVSSDSPGSSCPGFGAWSVWILPVADQSGAAVAWISSRPFRVLSFQAPCVPLEFSFCKLVSALVLFILVHLLVFPQLRLSVMWYSCNIGSPLVITL